MLFCHFDQKIKNGMKPTKELISFVKLWIKESTSLIEILVEKTLILVEVLLKYLICGDNMKYAQALAKKYAELLAKSLCLLPLYLSYSFIRHIPMRISYESRNCNAEYSGRLQKD